MRNDLDNLLDRLTPAHEDESGNWDGVLRRAGIAAHQIEQSSRAATRARRRLRRPRLLAGGLAAASVVAVVVVGSLVGRGGTGTATAAEVEAKLAEAVTRVQSIRGSFTVRTRPAQGPVDRLRRRRCGLGCRPAPPIPSTFVIGVDGSYAEHTRLGSFAYDASTGVLTEYQKDFRFHLTATGNDPTLLRYSPEAQLAAWVRRAVASGNPHVENTAFDGRPAWKLTLTFTLGDDFYSTYGVRVDVIVDRATGLVLQVTQYADTPNRWTSIESIRQLKVGGPTSRPDFVVKVPAGAKVIVHDYGFRRTTVAKAAAVVGYRPLLPQATGGRPLAIFAVAKRSDQNILDIGPLVVRAPVFRDAVSARYGRGLDSFDVSTRRGRRTDLSQLFEGISARTLTLTGGALAGANAYLSTSPPNPGYLAAFQNGLVIQVTATSADEALAIANSLAPAPR